MTRQVTDSGKGITERQIGTLFRKAHLKFVSVREDVSGFRATGIKPLNPRVLSEKTPCLLSQQTMGYGPNYSDSTSDKIANDVEWVSVTQGRIEPDEFALHWKYESLRNFSDHGMLLS
jgi:hypothetical protein